MAMNKRKEAESLFIISGGAGAVKPGLYAARYNYSPFIVVPPPPLQYKALVCPPTYNEAENIEPFINTVFDNAPTCADVLVIDDNSPDGTAHIVKNVQKNHPERLHLLSRPGKQGLTAAYLAAFHWGLSRNYDLFLEIDADFSHNPKYLPEMFREIQTHDLVIGSRNIQGGGIEGWSLLRSIISKAGLPEIPVSIGCFLIAGTQNYFLNHT
jgi:glycosyltransferase involved in cell wall biosynthesis